MITPFKSYKGLVKGYDPGSGAGRYKIYIPALMSHDPEFKSIWAINCTSSFGRWSPFESTDSEEITKKSAGSYFPLQIGMTVDVTFENTSEESGKITQVHNDGIPLSGESQQQFYLFGKTPETDTWIYTDEKRNLTHIMHNGGNTNIILDKDQVTISKNQVSKAGVANTISSISCGDTFINLKFGDEVYLIIDDGGFKFRAGDSHFDIGKEQIKLFSKNIDFDAKEEFNLQALRVYTNGLEENHITGNVTRLTGSQQVAVNSNVVSVESSTLTSIQGMSLELKSTTHTNLTTLGIHTQSAIAQMWINAPAMTVSGQTLAINGVSTAINGSSVFIDSMLYRGMGMATGICASMDAMGLASQLAFKGYDLAMTTAMGMNDGVSGMVSALISSSLNTGTAQGASQAVKVKAPAPDDKYINSTIDYVKTGNKTQNAQTIVDKIMSKSDGNKHPILEALRGNQSESQDRIDEYNSLVAQKNNQEDISNSNYYKKLDEGRNT